MELQQIPPRHTGGWGDASPDTDSIQDEKRLKALNAERQKSLVSDTNRLLKLAHELNDEVGSAGTEAITPSEFSKAAEIEKLAHRVKDKMSTSVRPTSESHPLTLPQF